MTGTRMNEAYDKAKKCLDQLLSNDQIPFYGYVEIMLQLDTMKREGSKETDDWQKYSDELWKNAYERGKADAYEKAKWIPQTDYDGFTYWKCSKCGKKNDYEITDFCFRCGADMRGEKSNE